MKQKQKKNMKLKRLCAQVKILEDYNESDRKMAVMVQDVKEEDIQKVQDKQQVREMQPRLVKVELKEAQVHQEAQDDEIQTLKQAEENENIESDFSGFLKIVFSGIQGFCEGFGSYHPPDSKPKRVKLVLKK